MRPDIAVLADAGHVRDGLLYVIGGGIDRVESTELPVPLHATIIARILLDPEDIGKEHELRVRVTREEGELHVATVQGVFHADKPPPTAWAPGLSAAVALNGIQLPSFGFYRISLEIGDQVIKAFRLQIVQVAKANRSTRRKPVPPNPTVRPKPRRR